jgi:hypothetical protein
MGVKPGLLCKWVFENRVLKRTSGPINENGENCMMRNFGRIILKLTLKKEQWEYVDWFHLGQKKRPDVSTCEHGMHS